MKKLETTYKDFCNLVKNDPSKQYYIKTDKGEFTKIHAVGSKITDSWKIKFSTGYEIIVGDRHAFMSENGEPLFANELAVGDKVKTTNGLLEVTESSFHKSNDMMYDISIDSPHWYVNDENGIIHHNTLFSMLCAKAYLDKYDDAVLIFYDSEMGASKDYFNSLEIDMDRVFHVPITNIEELKFDIMSQLQELKRGDHAIIVIDSIGNLASAKEIDDAINEKSAADMTRAKQLKSLTRMITPYLNILNIPMIMVNHIYMEIGMFPKAITSGGCVEKGTQIIMSDNTLKCIEDVEVGDMVKTMDGNFKVTHTWNPNTLENGTPECYKVTFEDGTTVVCSDIHRFRKNGKWEYIANMSVGDDVDTLAE